MIVSSMAAAFDTWWPAASALPEDAVQHPTVDVHLAVLNLDHGVKVVLRESARLVPAFPNGVEDLERLSSLGKAVRFAQVRLDRTVAGPSAIRPLMSEAARLRRLVLGSAELLASTGVLDADRLRPLRRHRGPLGIAGDCVVLYRLLRDDPAAWAGRVAFTPEDLAELGRVGGELVAILRPDNAPRVRRKTAVRVATDRRDRLWTLLVEAWERDLWRAGAFVFGRSVDEHVPALGARARAKKSAG